MSIKNFRWEEYVIEFIMTQIKIETNINAPIERVFDLACSIDLHKSSTTGTNERVIKGKKSGFIELGDIITWRAKHLGIYQNLTVKIIAYDRPYSFTDIMLQGAFKTMKHTHQFRQYDTYTTMTDLFEFTSPLGILGRLFNNYFLEQYMTQFLKNKNQELKSIAESERWQALLG